MCSAYEWIIERWCRGWFTRTLNSDVKKKNFARLTLLACFVSIVHGYTFSGILPILGFRVVTSGICHQSITQLSSSRSLLLLCENAVTDALSEDKHPLQVFAGQ